jgi:hypothetical protein
MLSKIQNEKFIYAIDEVSEEMEKEYISHIDQEREKDKIDYIMNKGKQELIKKLGHLPTDDQLETYKNEYMKEYDDDILYNEEIYNLDSTPKGNDILDQGADYGGFNDYDFETGDGFYYENEE